MNLRPRKLDIFIAKQFCLLFVATFFICQFVLMMQFLFQRVEDLIGKGLSMEVLAQFFWYAGLMLVPTALPLAILLSTLITFGNLGESSELTAIKAAGISLMQAFRSLIVITIIVTIGSFYFQNNIGPKANLKIAQLIISMRQKNPELEIPEGVFYGDIPGSNIYVTKKNNETGKLYGLTIYKMTGSYEDQAIILADSGTIRSTADDKHLLLTLWDGEWFENMQAQELGGKANVPYRREAFYYKEITIDYDPNFNMTDAAGLSNDARGKSLDQIFHSIDSLDCSYDSIGRRLYSEMGVQLYSLPKVKGKTAKTDKVDMDSVYIKLSPEKKKSTINNAMFMIKNAQSELEFRSIIAKDGDRIIRQHKTQAIGKFTLALSCLIFFFIGAPLGAIIRKGGFGTSIIISVLVFIVFYILDNTGTRMVKIGAWNLWFGCLLATAVLSPLAVFITRKANSDSMVFNIDAYTTMFKRLLGLRTKRHIYGKEVIINDPDYSNDAERLAEISQNITEYAEKHHIRRLPNPIKVFFRYEPDHEIERINEELEKIIEDLSNTRDKVILTEINHYPIIAVKAHTRPFGRRWMNIVSAIIIPIGIFLYFRMVRFRLRLYKDLVDIKQTNNKIIAQIEKTL